MTNDPSPLDRILAATIPAGLAVSLAVRRSILRAIRANRWGTPNAVLAAVRDALQKSLPLLADSFRDSLIASWIGAAHLTAEDALAEEPEAWKPVKGVFFDDPLPIAAPASPNPPVLEQVHLEFTDRGFDWLQSRKLVTSSHFRELDRAARYQAEVIAHATSDETAAKLATAMQESLKESGGTLAKFQKKATEALSDTPLADWQTETLYRTNGGRAYAAGQQYALSQPLVGSGFPYVLYSATHDARTRPDHLMMEKLGLDGTAVYRADDPVIRRFWCPWSWNCRCVCIPIDLRTAASYGVREAKLWIETGRPPAMPEYVAFPPFDLPPGWVPVNPHGFPSAVA